MPGSVRLFVLAMTAICQACSLSDHVVVPSKLGQAGGFAAMEQVIDAPGPIDVETINSADWVVPLAGLVDLKSPAARAADESTNLKSLMMLKDLAGRDPGMDVRFGHRY
jgi:hypothetical protein